MTTTTLEDIASRVADGLTLTNADAEALASTYDIVSLGMLADDVRRARHGTRTTFLRVAHMAAAVAPEAGTVWPRSAREVRLGGTFSGIEQACAAVRAVASSATAAAVSGFSLADLEHAAGGDIAQVRAWLESLREAGLQLVDDAPIDALGQPVALLRAAAETGVPVARVTVRAAPPDGPLSLLRLVAALHAETGAVRAFAPIPRSPGAEPTTGYQDVKAVALARILLPAVEHIQADWTLHGPKLAQVALTFGADDMDNVSAADEAAEGRRRTPLEDVRRNIRAAGFEAVERDPGFALVG